jgi:hypothetical protein
LYTIFDKLHEMVTRCLRINLLEREKIWRCIISCTRATLYVNNRIKKV